MKVRKWFKIAFVFSLMITLTSLIMERMVFVEKVVNAQAPSLSRSFNVTASGAQAAIGNVGLGLNLHRVTWQIVGGTASACTLTLQSSSNNSTWATFAGTRTETCTADGAMAYTSGSPAYVRINVNTLTLSAGASLNVRWEGFSPILGTAATGYSSLNISGALNGTNVLVKSGPGILHGVYFYNSTASGSLSCQDTTSFGVPTSTDNGYLGTSFGGVSPIIVDLYFKNGLSCLTSGTSQWAVEFR